MFDHDKYTVITDSLLPASTPRGLHNHMTKDCQTAPTAKFLPTPNGTKRTVFQWVFALNEVLDLNDDASILNRNAKKVRETQKKVRESHQKPCLNLASGERGRKRVEVRGTRARVCVCVHVRVCVCVCVWEREREREREREWESKRAWWHEYSRQAISQQRPWMTTGVPLSFLCPVAIKMEDYEQAIATFTGLSHRLMTWTPH